MAVQLARYLFTVTEYERMGEVGILTEDDRVELIEGEIVEMSPIGIRHVACVNRLNKLFNRHLGDKTIVSIQNPIRLQEYSEPQPDVTLLRLQSDFYAEGLPGASDILVLIEVADSTLDTDRQVKIPMYARASILEVWLVNLQDDSIEVYTHPLDGAYQDVRVIQRGEALASPTFPELVLNADEILG